MKKEVQRLLEKADHALEVAESLYKQGFIQDASSRIYYAMFYAAQALLKSENIDMIWLNTQPWNLHWATILLKPAESIQNIIAC